MAGRHFIAALSLLISPLISSSLGHAQAEQQLLVRVELVLESCDPSIDVRSVMDAVEDSQKEANGRALTVLHVVVPVGGDAVVHVHELGDERTSPTESFVIPRGEIDWLRDGLLEHVTRRLVEVRAPPGSLLFSWDGSRSIDAPAGLVEWRVFLVEDGANLSSPPQRH